MNDVMNNILSDNLLKDKYRDSFKRVYENIPSRAVLLGTIVSKNEEGSHMNKLIVENRDEELYEIYYSSDQFDFEFQVGQTYHFKGMTTTTKQENTDGAISIEEVVDFNKHIPTREENFYQLEKMLKAIEQRKTFEEHMLQKYKQLPVKMLIDDDYQIIDKCTDDFKNFWKSVEKSIGRLAESLYIDIYAPANSITYWSLPDYLEHTYELLLDLFNLRIDTSTVRSEFIEKFEEECDEEAQPMYIAFLDVVTDIIVAVRKIEFKLKLAQSSAEKEKILRNELGPTWQQIFSCKIMPVIKSTNDDIEHEMKQKLYKDFDCSEDEYLQWVTNRKPVIKTNKVFNQIPLEYSSQQEEKFHILEKLFNTIAFKRIQFETEILPKHKTLPIQHNTIGNDNVLIDFISEVESVWSQIFRCVNFVMREYKLDYEICSHTASYSYSFDILIEDLKNVSDVISTAFTNQAQQNSRLLQFERKYGHQNNGVKHGIITNSFSYHLAFAVYQGISDTIRDIEHENNVYSNFEKRQAVLINKLNSLWTKEYNTKIVPQIIQVNDEVEREVKYSLYEKFCTNEEEYKQWLLVRKVRSVDNTDNIKTLQDEIKKNNALIASAGLWPFGEKAREKRERIEINNFLEKEINALQNYKSLDISERWVKAAFKNWDEEKVLGGTSGTLKFNFNQRKGIYEICHEDKKHMVLAQMDKNFTAEYGRFRKIYCEVLGTAYHGKQWAEMKLFLIEK